MSWGDGGRLSYTYLIRLPTHSPALAAHLTWGFVWRGSLGFPRDGKPFLGPVPGRPAGVFVCGGFSGHGMPRCFGHARMAAQLVNGAQWGELEEGEEARRCDVARVLGGGGCAT